MESIKINVMQKLLKANDAIADEIRNNLKSKGIFFINLMSSPGSGKTTLIEETVKKLGKKIKVIEGDIQTTLDAERLQKLGVQAFQINTLGTITSLKVPPVFPKGWDPKVVKAWVPNFAQFEKLRAGWVEEWNKIYNYRQ